MIDVFSRAEWYTRVPTTLPTPDDLRLSLEHFTNSEVLFRHPLNPRMKFTEGVRYFAETAAAYWFLDIIATEIWDVLGEQRAPDVVITLLVENGQAQVVIRDDQSNYMWGRGLGATDCPEGVWYFHFDKQGLLSLPGEAK